MKSAPAVNRKGISRGKRVVIEHLKTNVEGGTRRDFCNESRGRALGWFEGRMRHSGPDHQQKEIAST
jgi:hypothetical protein